MRKNRARGSNASPLKKRPLSPDNRGGGTMNGVTSLSVRRRRAPGAEPHAPVKQKTNTHTRAEIPFSIRFHRDERTSPSRFLHRSIQRCAELQRTKKGGGQMRKTPENLPPSRLYNPPEPYVKRGALLGFPARRTRAHRHDTGGIALPKHERLPVKPQTYRAEEHDAVRAGRSGAERWNRSRRSLQTHCCQQNTA